MRREFPPVRMIWPQLSVVPRLKNPCVNVLYMPPLIALASFFFKLLFTVMVSRVSRRLSRHSQTSTCMISFDLRNKPANLADRECVITPTSQI